MLSQIFCYWGKQQSAASNIIQFHLTLKCTKDQSFRFCDCVLISKWIFQHHDRDLTKFHAGSEQTLVCVIINSSYSRVKNNNTAYHAFGKYWMQARGFLNYRLKYCWPKVIYCVCQPNERKEEIKKNTRDQANIWGVHGPPRSPLEPPLQQPFDNLRETWATCSFQVKEWSNITPKYPILFSRYFMPTDFYTKVAFFLSFWWQSCIQFCCSWKKIYLILTNYTFFEFHILL